jgi:hypothetical protein
MAHRREQKARTAEEYAQEAHEYFANARAILRRIPIRDRRYTDLKRVREACGTAYLAVLAALKSHFLRHGHPAERLPREYKAYGQMLARYSAHNGKVMSAYHDVYSMIHLDGYYGGFTSVEVGKMAFAQAQFLIERLTGRRVAD